VLLLVLLSAPWRTAMIGSDGDPCLHRRVGEHMLETRQVIRADVFSHTRPGRPVYSKEWLAEIIFAVAGRVGGFYGMCVVTALLIAGTFWLLYRQLAREGSDLAVAGLLVALAASASSFHWLARPHAFSFLMMVLWNDGLRRFERSGRFAPLAGVLMVLTLLWVNLHGAFLAGFVVLGAYWLGAAVERDRPKLWALTRAGLLCAVASLVNPNGWRLHFHNVQFLRTEFFVNYLAEYKSPDFHSPESLGLILWLALLFLVLALRRPRVPASEGVLLLVWTYFALYAVRNVPFLTTLTAPLLARALSESVPARRRATSERLRQLNASARGGVLVFAAAVALVVFVPRPTALPAERWPVAAVQFIKNRPADFAGPMLNQYAWGGFLLWELPEHKVFVDGRTDFYGEELVKEFRDATALRPNWQDVFRKYDVQWSLMPCNHRLNLALALLPQWSCVYTDNVATIYRRTP
jgi:hypothetical protein